MHLLTATLSSTGCRAAVFSSNADVSSLSEEACTRAEFSLAGITSPEDLAKTLTEQLGLSAVRADAAVIAAGTTPLHGVWRITPSLRITETSGKAVFGDDFRIIPVSTALAESVATPAGRDAFTVPPLSPLQRQAGEMPSTGIRAVVSADTDFSSSTLIPAEHGSFQVFPSAAGHQAFAFASWRERAFCDFLRETTTTAMPKISDVLSEQGLLALARFMGTNCRSCEEVSRRYLSCRGASPLRDMFACLLARVCANWILSTLCTGGLWIAGSIAVRNPFIVTCDAFRRELARDNRPDFVRKTPIHLFRTEYAELFGCAAYALRHLKTPQTQNAACPIHN